MPGKEKWEALLGEHAFGVLLSAFGTLFTLLLGLAAIHIRTITNNIEQSIVRVATVAADNQEESRALRDAIAELKSSLAERRGVNTTSIDQINKRMDRIERMLERR